MADEHYPRRVVVVTGGAAGIGAAIAEEIGRHGAYVVTVDPMVTVDGSERSTDIGLTTAERIVAAGGQARASNTSVTDGAALENLFKALADEFGSLDAVVNAAGISRPSDFATGSDEDWLTILDVHLGGYVNVLRAALPIMVQAGRGRILGVTSGSGWRPGNVGAYGCAKRAVAALTWQIGRAVPTGVTVNALCPIAATRMVTAALARRAEQNASDSTAGGVSLELNVMPTPEMLGPIGAYLASEAFSWCSGEVVFSNGSEVASVRQPGLLEVVRTSAVKSLARALDTVVPTVLVPAEQAQATNGASNARLGAIYDDEGEAVVDRSASEDSGSSVVVSDDEGMGMTIADALTSRGVRVSGVGAWRKGDLAATTTEEALSKLELAGAEGPVSSVVTCFTSRGDAAAIGNRRDWSDILDGHGRILKDLAATAAWARATCAYSERTGEPVTFACVTPAGAPGGRSQAQALAQLTRGAQPATGGRVHALAIGVESTDLEDERTAAEFLTRLVTGGEAAQLTGAELAVGSGWLALRAHPTAGGSVSFGGPEVPLWLDSVLRELFDRESE